MTKSAASKAASTSPRSSGVTLARLEGSSLPLKAVRLSSLTRGEPSAIDSSRDRITGNRSYSTSMAAAAAAASARVDAATAAKAWPT